MPRFRFSLALAVLVLASLMLTGPAGAGGPTSALLAVPGQGKTASLYYTDPEYDALAGLVGIDSEAGVGKVDKSGRRHDFAPGVTVTWLIHDVLPWRVDQIYLDGPGAPWIATQVSLDDGTPMDGPVVWHQPASPAELVTLLDRLGVGGASHEAGEPTGVEGGPALPAAADPAPSPDEPVSAAVSSHGGVWWALGGLAGCVLLTGLWVRRHRAATTTSHETGEEAVDASGTVREELTWPAPRG